MSKYFCPYCDYKYQFKSMRNRGKLLCDVCGEEMIKKSFINLKQIVSLIIVSSFILPLLYAFIILIINRQQIKKDINQGYTSELKKFTFNKVMALSSAQIIINT